MFQLPSIFGHSYWWASPCQGSVNCSLLIWMNLESDGHWVRLWDLIKVSWILCLIVDLELHFPIYQKWQNCFPPFCILFYFFKEWQLTTSKKQIPYVEFLYSHDSWEIYCVTTFFFRGKLLAFRSNRNKTNFSAITMSWINTR